MEEGTPPEKDYEVDRWLFEDPPEREDDERCRWGCRSSLSQF